MATAITSVGVQAAFEVKTPPIGDGYGKGTIGSAGVPLTILIPPVKDHYTRVTGIHYDCSTTSHTITFMVPIGDTNPTVTADVAVNGTTIVLSSVPHDSQGNAPASGDWLAVRGTDGQLYRYKVASFSGTTVTITVTSGHGDANGTGVAATIPIGNQVWFYGAPDGVDQTRQLIAKASTVTTINFYLCTTPRVYQPILVHSDNGTAAATSIYVSADNPKSS